jgi:hypothetical protein
MYTSQPKKRFDLKSGKHVIDPAARHVRFKPSVSLKTDMRLMAAVGDKLNEPVFFDPNNKEDWLS